jgi:probable selenium-dependent hydroxylase accessory protein YqeC
MWYIRKIDPLSSIISGKYASFVGAGGKTSLAEYLATEALAKGMRVALTTTTKIWAKEPYVALKGGPRQRGRGGRLVRVGKSVENGKLTGLDEDELAALGAEFDIVLIEADGSKGMPLKYPADFEPVIPSFTDRIVVVAGLDGLSGLIAGKVFRWELLSKKTGLTGEMPVDGEIFLRLFGPDGMMKGVDSGKCVVVLNKYDACSERQQVLALAREVSGQTRCSPVIVASVRHGIFYGVEALGSH